MTKYTDIVRLILNWVTWFGAKLLIIKGHYASGLISEAASRVLG